MRQERTVQASIFDLFAGHEIGRELRTMSAWLDDHRELASLVAADLRRHGIKATGRQGLPAEAVLRCALLKQHRQVSYQELAFHLEDSASFRAFARLPHAWSPQKSVLHRTISAIRAETWEQVNRTLLTSARETLLRHPHHLINCRLWMGTSYEQLAVFSVDGLVSCWHVPPGGRLIIAGDSVGQIHVLEILL